MSITPASYAACIRHTWRDSLYVHCVGYHPTIAQKSQKIPSTLAYIKKKQYLCNQICKGAVLRAIMENNLQYSIIYADIRPEIKERLSLGVMTIEQNKVRVYYSQKKLGIVKLLYKPKEYKVISSIVRKELRELDSVETLKYLTRYSNNLISFSPIQSIDKTQTNINGEWLYKNYVYDAATA